MKVPPAIIEADLMVLLEQQVEAYLRLRDLAQQQHRLVAQDEPQELLRILADRQRLVDDLSRLNQSLAPYRRDWAGAIAQRPVEQRERVRELIDRQQSLLSEILSHDERDVQALAGRRDWIRGEMGRQTQSARAAAAYGNRAMGGAFGATDARV